MTPENKELLLKYLCMAFPYGVKILHEGWNYEWDDELSTVERVVGIDEIFIYTKVIDTHNGEEYREDSHSIDSFDDKPYLRPMSSMTEEEMDELESITFPLVEKDWDGNENPACVRLIDVPKYMNFILSNHFDFMGLIPKGLAIGVTENNNPYK